MKIKKRVLNEFGIIGKLNGDEDEVSSKEEIYSLEWISDKNVFYKHSNRFDYLLTIDNVSEKYFGTVIGYIFGSGKDIGLEEIDQHIGLMKLKNKLKNV